MLLIGKVIIHRSSALAEDTSFLGMDDEGNYYTGITQPLIFKDEKEAKETKDDISNRGLLKSVNTSELELVNLWID